MSRWGRQGAWACATLACVGAAAAGPGAAAAAPATARIGPAPRLDGAYRIGALDPAQDLQVQFALRPRDPAGLDDVVRQVSTPGDAGYGQYLTPGDYARRFGPTDAQVAGVTAFLRGSGFQVTGGGGGSQLVNARAPAGVVSRALATPISRFRDRATGREFHANELAPAIPVALAPLVNGVIGLDNRALRSPAACCAAPPYRPGQVRTGYGFTAAPLSTLTGSGQDLGLLELDRYDPTNVAVWQANDSGYSTFGTIVPEPVDGGADPLTHTNGGEVEAELDIEVMEAYAHQANVLVFEAPNTDTGLNDAFSCMVNPNTTTASGPCPNRVSGALPPAISTSWGECEQVQGSAETAVLHAIFEQAAAQGQGVFAASGDNGAHDCLSADPTNNSVGVDSPASDPFVTGTGGTTLLLDAGNSTWVSPENAWSGSGGGFSMDFNRPSWQVAPGVLQGSSNGQRQVPDVALDGDPNTGYLVYSCTGSPTAAIPCSPGQLMVGGTSAAAPGWAAFEVLYNQYAASVSKPALGFANPALYTAASCPGGYQPFHDAVQGGNGVYQANPGWDALTGLGTPNAAGLARALATATPGAPSISTVTPARGPGTGGNHLLVSGCGFASGATVRVGSAPPSAATFLDATALDVVAPGGPPGSVDVTVTNPSAGGSATLPSGYHYNRGAGHQQMVTNIDGRLEMAITGPDGLAYHSWEGRPSGPFGGWYSLGGPSSGAFVSDPASGLNPDGRVEDLEVASDGTAWHAWQWSAGGGWSPFYSLGRPGSATLAGVVALATNSDGRLEAFARASDGQVWHAWQVAPNGGWTAWYPLGLPGSGTFVSDVAAGRNGDGRLEIAAIDAAGTVWHAWQSAPSGGWSAFYTIPGRAVVGTPGINTNQDGRLEVFAAAADTGAIVHSWQIVPSGGWGGWYSLGGKIGSDTNVARNSDGRLEVFANDQFGNLIHTWQVAPGSGWIGPFSLGQPAAALAGVPQSGTNTDGRVQVIVPDVGGPEWQTFQVTAGGGWSNWSGMGSGRTLAY